MTSQREINNAKARSLRLLQSPLDSHGKKNLKTKFNNVCGKTGSYGVPEELFQNRTHRKNRVLISWKTVKTNELTLEQLNAFEGGVVVEFVNKEFFQDETGNDLFNVLKSRIGSDLNVSAMISIRGEDGKPDSRPAREAFKLLKDAFPNWKNELIRRRDLPPKTQQINIGNEKLEGFVFVRIAGGEQDTFRSHGRDANHNLFNPACEYASAAVSDEIDLVVRYFALHSMSSATKANAKLRREIDNEIETIGAILRHCVYDDGNLLDYCNNHPTLKFGEGELFDPIQFTKINVEDFGLSSKSDLNQLNLAHNEAVEKERYKFDVSRKEILSPARPQNIFWSKQLSNMMQQNFTLDEYFAKQDEWYKRRHGID